MSIYFQRGDEGPLAITGRWAARRRGGVQQRCDRGGARPYEQQQRRGQQRGQYKQGAKREHCAATSGNVRPKQRMALAQARLNDAARLGKGSEPVRAAPRRAGPGRKWKRGSRAGLGVRAQPHRFNGKGRCLKEECWRSRGPPGPRMRCRTAPPHTRHRAPTAEEGPKPASGRRGPCPRASAADRRRR